MTVASYAFDESFVDSLINQDEIAFRQLVSRYHRTMVNLARSIVGESLAEEVVQEAWMSVYDHLPKFEKRSALKSWIYRITANQAISCLRKEARSISFSQMSDDGNDLSDRFTDAGQWLSPPGHWHNDNPETLLTSEELKDCIDLIQRELPKMQHAVFILRDIEGKATEDICNILEISASNLRVLLHRARMTLFNHVDHFQETGEC